MSLGTIHIDMERFSRAGSSSLAMTRTFGKNSPWVTHVFCPDRMYVPSGCFLVTHVMAWLSEPAAGSEKPSEKMGLPVSRYCPIASAICSSLAPKSMKSRMASVLFSTGSMQPE